ncbi:Stage V sporulation protein G [Peptoniphilus sp. ING2-D1G]|nr:septation regulator SpoVG [Peptoniphilus sp.]CDZ74981.1 Stage V sporulation protein G [Peptoniphilus sp. ING2-D1G]
MNITDVRIRKLPDEGKMKAIVSVTFDDQIVIHDIKIIEGAESLFIAMPSRKLPNGEFRDIAHPINSEARKMVEDAVFAKYDEILKEEESEEE